MKVISVDIDKEKNETFSSLLKDNLSCFVGLTKNEVNTSRDITTDEYEIIKVAEKLCQMREVQEQTR